MNTTKFLKTEQKASQLSASNITFSIFDQNSDQRWSLDELRAYIRNHLHRRTDNANKVLIRFDSNNDTKLDLEEFSRLDFAFPFEEFPVSFNIPQPIIGQATTINSKSYFQPVHTSRNKNNTQP
ncbi:hypothetical protein M3Y97_00513800 [Aphelenchoides bicaudatus]|nr:hypothetical protein M3Y97_00513800 [Aphelenchoides bicaudatus]